MKKRLQTMNRQRQPFLQKSCLRQWALRALWATLLPTAMHFFLQAPARGAVDGEMLLLKVDKNAYTAELYLWPEHATRPSFVRRFPIAIGKKAGNKQVEGDHKTPEGIYFTQTHIPGRGLPKKYGPLAIPLDYPNPMDRLANKTGYGIWLHGVDDAKRIEERNATEGCVAFFNEDILLLREWLAPRQAVVLIADDLAGMNEQADLSEIEQATTSWLKHWQQRNLDGYVASYHTNYRHPKARSLKAFKRYKRAVFRSYRKMSVEMDHMRYLSYGDYAVSIMNQRFQGDQRYRSYGSKVLYWKRNDKRRWQIVREVFASRPFATKSVDPETLAAVRASGQQPPLQEATGAGIVPNPFRMPLEDEQNERSALGQTTSGRSSAQQTSSL